MVFLSAIAAAGSLPAHSTLQEVQAGDVLGQIRNGAPIYYDGVNISGNLDLSGLGKVNSSLLIINSSIPDSNFAGVTFEKDVVFWGSTFGNASFDKTAFIGLADFSNTSWRHTSFSEAVFNQPVVFDGTEFLSSVNFENAQFRKDTLFNSVRFLGDAYFNYSHFSYYSYFAGSRFFGNASFSDIKFDGMLDFSSVGFAHDVRFVRSEFDTTSFSDSFFGGLTQFGLARFHRLAGFDSSIFAQEANFALSRFEDAVSFSNASFRGDAIFGGIKFERLLSFRGANFEKKLNLRASQIYDVLLENATFGAASKIILEDADFSIFRAPWGTIGDHVQYNGGAYIALIKNYKDLNWFGDSNDCYYSYRKLSLDYEPMSPMKFMDYLAWMFYGFGVKPEIPLGWSVFIILALGLVFMFIKSLRKFTRKETIKMIPSKDGYLEAQIETTLIEVPVSFIDPFLFSLSNFTSGWTTFLYPFTDFKTAGGHSHLAIVERILGSIFISLILAAIVKTYLIR
ncbi:MAG: pentapeptide repeat-containing protein [Methanotrichaceae archaeon]